MHWHFWPFLIFAASAAASATSAGAGDAATAAAVAEAALQNLQGAGIRTRDSAKKELHSPRNLILKICLKKRKKVIKRYMC